jgi:hypothetical protein
MKSIRIHVIVLVLLQLRKFSQALSNIFSKKMNNLFKITFQLLAVVSSSYAFWSNSCPGNNTPFQCKCLKKLNNEEYNQYSKCQQILNSENVANDGIQYCCAIREFERCALNIIIKKCHELGIKLFENQVRAINSLCTVITDDFNICDSFIPTPVYNFKLDGKRTVS